ncbi:MAG: hypothetical protein AAFV93_04120 [Chloroflexota bacterium]
MTKHNQATYISRRLTMLIVISLCLMGLSFVPLQAQDAEITVDAETVIAQVSPYAYGANFGPLSVVPLDLFEEAESVGITFLRFPGGRWGDLNDISEFQVDQLMRTARLTGAEPSIHVRLENGTPEAAVALLNYANVENDYDIKYWYVGNEPNLFDDYTVQDHATQWREIALALKEADPSIQIIGPGLSQWNGTPQVDPVDPNGEDWLRSFLRDNGDIVDIVDVHRYPFPTNQADPSTTIQDLRDNTAEWSNTVENLRQVVLEETGRDIPVAITEASSHWSANTQGEATPDSYYNAIWWADSLGRLLEDEPFIVAYYELQTPTNRGGWGLLGSFELHPTYYVYQLYQHFGTQMLATTSTAEYVTIYAAQRDDGALTLIVVNRGDEDVSLPITISGFEGDVGEVRLLTEDILAEVVDNTVLVDNQLSLPAQSVALVVLE